MVEINTDGNPRRKRFWWSCVAVSLAVVLGAGFLAGIRLELGSWTIALVSRASSPAFASDVFFHVSSAGPTGDFTTFDSYGVKALGRCLGVDIVSDPIGAARRRLPTSLEGLIAALDSKDRWRRFCALERLSELGGAAVPAIPVLLKRLSGDPEVHETVAAISKAAPAAAVPLLTTAMGTCNAMVRCEVVEILGDMGQAASAAEPELNRRLHDPEGKVVLRSAYALTRMGVRAIDALPALRTLLKSPDAEVRAGAVVVLNEFGAAANQVLAELGQLLDDSNLQVRAMAARTIAGIRRESGGSALVISPTMTTRLELLGRGDDIAAQWAIDALSTMGTNGARILAEIYQTAEEPRRHQTAEALIRLGPQAAAALPVLLADLTGGDRGRTFQSARVVSSLGQAATNALAPLAELLQGHDAMIRVQAARAIWKINHGTELAVPVLLAELKSDSVGNSRRFAADALGEMDASEAVPLLEKLLGDARLDVRKAAAEALRKLRDGTIPDESGVADRPGRAAAPRPPPSDSRSSREPAQPTLSLLVRSESSNHRQIANRQGMPSRSNWLW